MSSYLVITEDKGELDAHVLHTPEELVAYLQDFITWYHAGSLALLNGVWQIDVRPPAELKLELRDEKPEGECTDEYYELTGGPDAISFRVSISTRVI